MEDILMEFLDLMGWVGVVLLVVAVMAAAVFWFISSKTYGRSMSRGGSGLRGYDRQRSDGYFQSMFPELQPHFHPKKITLYARARNARAKLRTLEWRSPPGFEQATAMIAIVEGGERVRLLDGAGAPMAEFGYERTPKGAALRIGQGVMTVELQDAENSRVHYRHPEREFKWSRKAGWQFTTPVTDHSFDSNDSGTRWSSETGNPSSGSAGRIVAAGATAALVSGAGGAFAGGGASDDWDAQAADGATAIGGGTAY